MTRRSLNRALCGALFLACGAVALAQGTADKPLPFDAAVRSGTLKNGLRYFIRKNAKPEDRAELRLVVKAGSVLEDPDQQGLAHFVEHMAFNGTKNFKKHEIIDFLESSGMRFGADLNAYTSFDETVYMLQLPTDNPRTLDRGIQVLEDWAHNIAFEDDEIDKERGVVIEEWRSRRGAEARIREHTYPVLLYKSPYPERFPIGQKEILDTFKHETVRRFYKDWYRPDLMAVVVVGDIDPGAIEKMVKDRFNRIPPSTNPRSRFQAVIPDHPQTLVAIATDPEATGSSVTIRYKLPFHQTTTEGDYRNDLTNTLFMTMLNQRLSELRQQGDPPFLNARGGAYNFGTAKRFFDLSAAVEDGGVLRGLAAVLAEAERVKRYGFTQTELDRTRQDMLRGIGQLHSESDKIESGSYASEYVDYFLAGVPSPGIEAEYNLSKLLLPAITLDDVDAVAAKLMPERNRAIVVVSPKKDSVKVPNEVEILATFNNVSRANLAAYVDKATDGPLIPQAPVPGQIIGETTNATIGTIEWKLSNGARVVLKPTDFKNDEVLFAATSPGGSSLASDEDYLSASIATAAVGEGGVGSFGRIELEKALTGKAVGVSPYIGELQEGMNGSASPEDLETMFQLIHLYFTSPRRDSTAFAGLLARTRASLQNRGSRPEQQFYDSLQAILSQHHPRRRPITIDALKDVDLDRALDFYRDRYADAGDFTFFFVGNLKPETIRQYVETYLASLPSDGRKETWRDLGVRPPSGVVSAEVRKGVEPKSQVALVFTGPFTWNRESRHVLGAVMDLLEYRLREVIREDKGGTYGVNIYASPVRYPVERYSAVINFGCAPDRVDELTKAALNVIEEFKKDGPGATDMEKLKETERRERESGLKQNGFWLGALQNSYLYGEDPNDILTGDRLIEKLTPEEARQAAIRYFDMNNYVRAVLYPEAKTP